MIVYGDPARDVCAEELLELARERPDRGAGTADDRARLRLIRCGQVEQAVCDGAGEDAEAAAAAMELTDAAARAFRGGGDPDPALERLKRALKSAGGAKFQVKTPEGFAFYALYPEQYVAAADAWARAHPNVKRVAVIGVRSIGTTLSAIVAATLRARGVEAARRTVRPSGDPSARRVALPSPILEGADCALVVDEGPGMSGSSMAAVAEALAERGFSADRIAFLPGHGGEPGWSAPEWSRRWWGSVERYATPLEAVRWGGCSLQEALADETARVAGPGAAVVRMVDVAGGLWRTVAYDRGEEWPPAAASFERTKWLCIVRRYGVEHALLWKYAMLDSAGEWERAERLARRGWTPPPVARRLGFIAREWVEGVPLRPGDADEGTAGLLGRYISEAAGPPLSEAEMCAARKRIREMTYWNVWESLGKDAADVAARVWDARTPEPLDWPSYGDGRMAPWEWIRGANGRLIKVDCGGHEGDHTIVGRLPALWDLAGASVEWDLCEELERRMLEAWVAAGGLPVESGDMRAYRLAYAAFRLGLMKVCASQRGDDPADRDRLMRAYEHYREKARRMLDPAQPSETVC